MRERVGGGEADAAAAFRTQEHDAAGETVGKALREGGR